MYTAIIILTMVVCLLLATVVILQNPKGGVAGSFGGLILIGVRCQAEVVEKLTWGLALSALALCMAGIFFV